MDVVFTGVDADHDGILSSSELSALSFSLTVDGSGLPATLYPVLPAVTIAPCGAHPECHSTYDSFSFNTTTKTLTQIKAGGLADPEDFLDFDGITVDVYGRAFWDASHASVTVSEQGGPAVPEPATPALALVGVVVLAATTVRRQSRS
jgi:hypothetical protein